MLFKPSRRTVSGACAALDSEELWQTARLRPGLLWRYRLWLNGHAHAVFGRHRSVDVATAATDAVHLRAAAGWLATAQDATRDGGIVGRYRLDKGWTSSYPETTGYIVPTFIALARTGAPEFLDRARRCIDFLLSTQLQNGAFPAGEIAANSTKPSAFNTGQIINGLLSWHQLQGDPDTLAAARRAGEWLISVQDSDGAWRRWSYYDIAACYSAHSSCWLAELGAYCGEERFLAGASRNVDWVLGQRSEPSGWIDGCGFTAQEHRLRIADLHTIGYTLAGLLRTSAVLGRSDAFDAVAVAARAVANTVERLGWLPGVLDHEWRARANYACLTGNAQMALIWMSLRDQTADDAWLDPAYRALDLVKKTQLLGSPNPSLRGGIAGADPFWGPYNGGTMLSWSTKFFIDALLRKAEIEAAR